MGLPNETYNVIAAYNLEKLQKALEAKREYYQRQLHRPKISNEDYYITFGKAMMCGIVLNMIKNEDFTV